MFLLTTHDLFVTGTCPGKLLFLTRASRVYRFPSPLVILHLNL